MRSVAALALVLDAFSWSAFLSITAKVQDFAQRLGIPQVTIAVVETYNTVLCAHLLLEHTDVIIMYDVRLLTTLAVVTWISCAQLISILGDS